VGDRMRFFQALDVIQQTFASPAAGRNKLGFKSDSHLWSRNSAGSEIDHARFDDPVEVFKTADTSITSTTIVDLPDLNFSVASGAHYIWEFSGVWLAANSGNAPFLCVNGPTIGTDGLLVCSITPPGLTGRRTESATAYDQPHGPGGAAVSPNVRWPWEVWGALHTAASGTFTMRYRTNINAQSITIHKGARGTLWRIA